MKRTPFYPLKRPLQERFIAATKGQTVPAPLAVRELRSRFPVIWVLCSLLAFVAFCVALTLGYGQLTSDFALVSTPMFALYGVLFAASIWCALQAWARFRRQQMSPFELATYLFPGVLIDATTPNLVSYPLAEAQVTQEGRRLVVRVSGRVEAFGTASAADAKQLKERVDQAQQEGAEAAKPGGEWHRFDPLAEPRYSSPLVARDKMEPYSPAWATWSPVIAIAIAAVVAGAVGLTRNRLSERKLYAAAVEQNTPAAYRQYLSRAGTEKRPDVTEIRLPSAELAELQAAGDLKALEQYAVAHEDSKIKAAIDAVLRQELVQALVEVARKDSMGEVRKFVEEHPKHALVEAEISNVRKKLTKRLYDDFVEGPAAKTEGIDDVFRDLLNYTSEHGPELEVRFQRIVLDKVERADKQVSNSKYFVDSMLPSQYFNAKRSRERETALFESFSKRFETAFAKDVLVLKRGEPIEPGQEPPAKPERPLLIISHSTTMGGGIGNTRPNGIFVGVGLVFEAHLFVPGREEPLSLRYSTWRMPELLKLREGKLTVPQVYEGMAQVAFDNFEKRLTDWLVQEPAKD